MDYNLALELKEAGFPQSGLGYYLKENGGKKRLDVTDDYNVFAYEPTLSELIEACREEFIYLVKDSNRWDAKSKTYIISKMPSPEEAVARLYLALNKK